jgi:FHS family L-fucose permease-like MFS transporter
VDLSVSQLISLRWILTYTTDLGVACFVALLVILFFLAPMPETTDADVGTQEMEIAEYDPGPLSKQYNLFLAVWSQFTYLGAQVSVAHYFVNFCEEAGKSSFTGCKPFPRNSFPAIIFADIGVANIFAAAQGLYAFNRFLAVAS